MFWKRKRLSPLQKFIRGHCSYENASRLFSEFENKEEAFSSSLMMTVLTAAGSFADGLTKLYEELAEECPTSPSDKAFEITVFEVAALCYASLLWQTVRQDTTIEKKGGYRRILNFSGELAVGFVRKSMPGETELLTIFGKRLTNYQLQILRRQNPIDAFTNRLHCSLVGGLASRGDLPAIEGGLTMVPLAFDSQLFGIHVLSAMVTSTTKLFNEEVAPLLRIEDDDEAEQSDEWGNPAGE